jgi:hypothetical protein
VNSVARHRWTVATTSLMPVQRDRPADEMTLGPAGLYAAASRSFNGPPVKRGEVAADVRGQALLIHRGAYFPRDRAQNDTMKAVIPGAGADLRHRSPDRLARTDRPIGVGHLALSADAVANSAAHGRRSRPVISARRSRARKVMPAWIMAGHAHHLWLGTTGRGSSTEAVRAKA